MGRRRYYVEVTGVNPDKGDQELEEAGISRERILVVEHAEDAISTAIREVTGVGMDGIMSHSRERQAVASRTMYVHFRLMQGDSVGSVCQRIGRDRIRVNYYANDYERKMYGDREFRTAAERVKKLLEESKAWKEARWEKPKVKKRKKGQRRRKKETTEGAEDARQLEIQWKS